MFNPLGRRVPVGFPRVGLGSGGCLKLSPHIYAEPGDLINNLRTGLCL